MSLSSPSRRRARFIRVAVCAGALLLATPPAPRLSPGTTPTGATWQQQAAASASIAVKLGPGARLRTTAAGKLTVVQDWPSLNSGSAGPDGLPLRRVNSVDQLGIDILQPSAAIDAGELGAFVKQLSLMPGVLWAEVGNPLHACLTPDDPWYPPVGTSVGEWGFSKVYLPEAWDLTTGSSSITVAFTDTGLNRDIRDFSGRIVSPYSVLTKSSDWPDWQDNDGHGSAVAAVGAAQGDDGSGIAGAAWNVRIMPIKISDNGDSNTDTLAAGIIHAVDNGANVINISFATPPGTGPGHALQEAVSYALGKNVTIVAAAGNDGGDSIAYPAALDGVIAVGATTSADARWTESDHGSNTGDALDLVAPGAQILSYYPLTSGSFTDDYYGTSLACPLVAGIAALMLSEDPSLTPAEITNLLTSTAKDLGSPGRDAEFGFGLADAEKAVAGAADLAASSASTTSTATTGSTTTTTSPTTSSTTTTTTTSTTTTTTTPRFSDVNDDTTPYRFQIENLASRGVVTGGADGLFHPADPLTRQQFAKMMVIALGYPVSEADTCPFVDVPHTAGSLYPYRYVAVAYRRGVTAGTSADHFSPYRTLTRAQLITMVARAAQLPEPPSGYTPPFPNFSAVHFPYARRAAYAGLLDGLVGMGSHYDFSAPATRGEVCALLYGLLE